MKKLLVFLCSMLLVFGMLGVAHATLFDRGGGLIYDSDQNLTWLQDANFAKTSGGYGNDGFMSWYTATDWVENLVYYDSVRNVNYSDWRLPYTASFGITDGYIIDAFGNVLDGGGGQYWPGQGYGITSSEMGYMYYVNLGGLALYDHNGILQTAGITINTDLFMNLDTGHQIGSSHDYWSSEFPYPGEVSHGSAWTFDFYTGYQVAGINKPAAIHYAWAVRDGDVSATSVPDASIMLLLGTSLMGLAVFSRKSKRS